jgi:AAA+ ATPase superfamily predicted ATPase
LFFDPRPKEKKEDLFDRERELERFSDALAYSPLILILGARRMGKTSLMNVALKESCQPYVMKLDSRRRARTSARRFSTRSLG